MNIDIRWTKLSAACGGGTLASMLRRERHNEKQMHKTELGEWENEGGNLGSFPKAPMPL